jgi:hypothetical protein
LASNLTHGQREQFQALQTRMADVRDLVCDAIRRRDFAAMECGFEVYRELLDEQRALVTGEPITERAKAGAPREPVLLGPWEYFSRCPGCRRTGTPQSWSRIGPEIRIEYLCRRCQRSWEVTGTEPVKRTIRVPVHTNAFRPELAATAPITRQPLDWFAVGGAIVAGIVLGGGVLLRLLPMVW